MPMSAYQHTCSKLCYWCVKSLKGKMKNKLVTFRTSKFGD